MWQITQDKFGSDGLEVPNWSGNSKPQNMQLFWKCVKILCLLATCLFTPLLWKLSARVLETIAPAPIRGLARAALTTARPPLAVSQAPPQGGIAPAPNPYRSIGPAAPDARLGCDFLISVDRLV